VWVCCSLRGLGLWGAMGKHEMVFLLLLASFSLSLSVSLCFRILIFFCFCFFFHHTSLHWAE
jgi:hypothetical protein